MITLCFTYETVTPESAEDGDFAHAGFWEWGNWKFPAEGYDCPTWNRPGDLRHFLATCRRLGMYWDGATDWLYTLDAEPDYATGEETQYSAHIDGCTPSTKRRILRLFAS